MSIRSSVMSPGYSSSPRRPGFLRKLVLFLTFIPGMAGYLGLLNFYQTNLPQFLMNIFAILVMGLSAGASSRALFYRWPGFFRFLLALLVLPLGMFFLGVFTNWQMGLGPVEPWLEGRLDWYQLAQLGGALLVSTIVLEGWWRPRTKSQQVASDHRRGGAHVEDASLRAASPQGMRRPQVQEDQPFSPKRNVRLMRASRVGNRNAVVPAMDRIVVPRKSQNSRSGRRKLFQRKANLQISRAEDHRCPFCLDEIKHNDSRGVRKCEVCNTLHHADCWDITGSCQVPHLNG